MSLLASLEEISTRSQSSTPGRLALEHIIYIDIATISSAQCYSCKVRDKGCAILKKFVILDCDNLLTRKIHISNHTNMVIATR